MSPLLRHPSQLEDIDNGYFSGTEGLIKRPPMILKKKLDIASLTSTSKPFLFPIIPFTLLTQMVWELEIFLLSRENI